MNEIDEMIKAVAAYVKADPTVLAEALKDGDKLKPNASEIINKELDKVLTQAVEAAKEKEKEIQTNLLKKTLSEKLSASEQFYIDLFHLPTGLKGDELQKAIKEKTEQLTNAQIEPDKVKAHPEFLKMQKDVEDRVSKAWEEKYGKLNTEFESHKANLEYTQVFSNVSQLAEQAWNEANVADMDASILTNQKQAYLNRLKNNYKYKIVEGETVLVDSEGQILKDKQGFRVNLSDVLKNEIVMYVPTKKSEERSGGGSGGAGGSGSGGGYKGKLPTTVAEANQLKAELLDQKKAKSISPEEFSVAVAAINDVASKLK